jgi:S-DNA-T family DNA segregation ATPase FtsK/SpoIIIE
LWNVWREKAVSGKLQKKSTGHRANNGTKARHQAAPVKNARTQKTGSGRHHKSQRAAAQTRQKSLEKKRQHKEFAGILIIAFSILCALSIYIRDLTGLAGEIILYISTGMLGFVAFFLPPILFVYGILLIFYPQKPQIENKAVQFFLLLVVVGAIFHAGSYNRDNYVNMSFLQYLKEFFKEGRSVINAPHTINGGLLGGLLSVPLCMILQRTGTIIVLGAFGIVLALMITEVSVKKMVSTTVGQVKQLYVPKADDPSEEGDEIDRPVFLKELDEPSPNQHGAGMRYEPAREADRGKVIDFPLERKPVIAEPSREAPNAAAPAPAEQMPVQAKEKKAVKKQGMTEEEIPISSVRVKPMQDREYQFPLFSCMSAPADGGMNTRRIKAAAVENVKKLEDTLLSFGIDARIVNVSIGPAFTRYELQPSPGVRVSRIVALNDDIALSLATQGIRIEAPIPGKAAVGIEVPNQEVAPIMLREVLETPDFVKFKSRMAVGLGKDISGENVIIDLAKMPHLLIAGATGSGKSVCINSIIISILYKATPEEVKLLMIDPKVVELGVYNGIPHLLIPVVTDPSKAAGALQWAVQEMVTRYKLFADAGVRDLAGYNHYIEDQGQGFKLPQIVIIIDELADLMMVAPHDVEDSICRLAQMARAAGMHLVIATQRPSVNVITGVIKANIPSRIAFAVSSQVDSRTILDMAGAEKLLGKGDMLYYPVGLQKPIRVKGTFVSDKEVEQVVEYVKSQVVVQYDEDIIDKISSNNANSEDQDMDADELLPQVIEMFVDCGQASVSLIQRRFKVGYARAGRIIDQIAERGIISGFEGSKPRRILISREQWEEMKMNSFDQG